MQSGLLWRPLTPSDLPALAAIAEEVHPDFPEDQAIFAERQRLYPAGAYLLERDGKAVGYGIGHPWLSGTIPALNRLLHGLPAHADTFYLHDLALLPAVQGSGAGRRIVDRMIAQARDAGFASMSLVAVNGSAPFWERFGFGVAESVGLAEKLISYGDAARLMMRALR